MIDDGIISLSVLFLFDLCLLLLLPSISGFFPLFLNSMVITISVVSEQSFLGCLFHCWFCFVLFFCSFFIAGSISFGYYWNSGDGTHSVKLVKKPWKTESWFLKNDSNKKRGDFSDFNYVLDSLSAKLDEPVDYLVEGYVSGLKEEVAESFKMFKMLTTLTLLEARRMSRV